MTSNMKPTFQDHIFKEKKSTVYHRQKTDSQKSDLETNKKDFRLKPTNCSLTTAI